MPEAHWKQWRKDRRYADGWQLYYGETPIAMASAYHGICWITNTYDPACKYKYALRHQFAETEAKAKLVGIDLAIAAHEQLDPSNTDVIAALKAYRKQLEEQYA